MFVVKDMIIFNSRINIWERIAERISVDMIMLIMFRDSLIKIVTPF